jgi:hypothetical protein
MRIEANREGAGRRRARWCKCKCPVDGVGRVQRVWEGWGDERRWEVTGEESEREREREREKERERTSKRARRGLKLAQGFIDSSVWPRNCAARCF